MERLLVLLAAGVCVLTGCTQTENTIAMRDEWNTNYLFTPTYNAKMVRTAAAFARSEAFGGVVYLDDATTWRVRGHDQRQAMRWHRDDHVIVVDSGDADWPYTIINLDTHDAGSVSARRGD